MQHEHTKDRASSQPTTEVADSAYRDRSDSEPTVTHASAAAGGAWPSEIRIEVYDNERDVHPKRRVYSRAQFIEAILTHRITNCSPCPGKDCSSKSGRAFSPALIRGGHTRANMNVVEIILAVLDLDHLTKAQLQELLSKLEGHAFVLVSTHSHRDDRIHLRLVMPLTRPVTSQEWPAVWGRLVNWLGVEKVDQAAKDPARLYFFASAARESPRVAISEDGAAWDVDNEPSAALDRSSTTAVTPLVQVSEISMGDIRAQLRSYARSGDSSSKSRTLVRRALNGDPLAQEGERDDSLQKLASAMAFTLGPSVPIEAALEIMRPSVMSMPGQEGGDHWMAKAAEKYERALERKRQADAERKAGLARLRQIAGASSVGTEANGAEARDSDTVYNGVIPSRVQPPFTSAVPLLPEDEQDNRFDKNYAAICNFLRNSGLRLLGGDLEWNEMEMVATVNRAPLTSGDRSRIRERLEALTLLPGGKPIRFSRENVEEAIDQVAQERSFHPVRDYLSSLIWDGVSRIEDLIGTVIPTPRTLLSRVVLRKWFVAAVARVMRPGCKADCVLIFVGPQGLGKSRFFAVLVGGSWFSDSVIDVHNKDAYMVLRHVWVLEWAELESMLRARAAPAVKAFVSSDTDIYRPPYGRGTVKVPRHSLIVGTTNDDEFLTDPTGNRRYWPIPILGEIDISALGGMRDQLWAEAAALYAAGEIHWLTNEEEAQLREVHARHEWHDPWEEPIRQYLDKHHGPLDEWGDLKSECRRGNAPAETTPETFPDGARKSATSENSERAEKHLVRSRHPVTTAYLLNEVLKKDKSSHTKNDEMRVGQILRRWGWKKQQGTHEGARIMEWLLPEPPPAASPATPDSPKSPFGAGGRVKEVLGESLAGGDAGVAVGALPRRPSTRAERLREALQRAAERYKAALTRGEIDL